MVSEKYWNLWNRSRVDSRKKLSKSFDNFYVNDATFFLKIFLPKILRSNQIYHDWYVKRLKGFSEPVDILDDWQISGRRTSNDYEHFPVIR